MTEPTIPRAEPITVAVADMTCGTCVANIEQALAGVSGVEQTDIRVNEGTVIVAGTATPALVVGAIEAAGYQARLMSEPSNDGQQRD